MRRLGGRRLRLSAGERARVGPTYFYFFLDGKGCLGLFFRSFFGLAVFSGCLLSRLLLNSTCTATELLLWGGSCGGRLVDDGLKPRHE